MTDERVSEMHQGFLAELSAVTAAILEGAGSVTPSDEKPGTGWTVTLKASEGARGELRLTVERAGAEALSKRASGSEVEPQEAAVVQTLTEICGASSTAFLQRMAMGSARLTVTSVQASLDGIEESAKTFVIAVGDWKMNVAIVGDIEAEALGESQTSNGTLNLILDIDLPLVVRFGRTEMSLKALTGLGPGSIIDLERSPEDPVDVFVSNQLVARGEVVIVGGSYGVRITEVRDAAERVRSMEVEW